MIYLLEKRNKEKIIERTVNNFARHLKTIRYGQNTKRTCSNDTSQKFRFLAHSLTNVRSLGLRRAVLSLSVGNFGIVISETEPRSQIRKTEVNAFQCRGTLTMSFYSSKSALVKTKKALMFSLVLWLIK